MSLSIPAGGITHDTFQKELMCFDPDADKWTQKAPMTTVRGLHCMCTVGDRLYVIGGNHFRGTSDYDDVLSCEYYSPALDLWTPIAAMLRGQSDVGVAVFENKIYVVGGYSWNNRCMVEIVQKYDPEKDEWQKVFDLPESLGGIRACTLTVFPPDDMSGSPSRESPLSAPWWVKKWGVRVLLFCLYLLYNTSDGTTFALAFLEKHLYCIPSILRSTPIVAVQRLLPDWVNWHNVVRQPNYTLLLTYFFWQAIPWLETLQINFSTWCLWGFLMSRFLQWSTLRRWLPSDLLLVYARLIQVI